MIKLLKNKLVVVMSVLTIMAGLAGGGALALDNYGADKAKELENYTLEEMLTYALQDEYLARAEYQVIMEEFGAQRPFSNIINAEDYHIKLLKNLFRDEDITIPEDKARDYVITPESIEEALKIAVQAEEDNIAMYDRFLAKDQPEAVKDVFTVLKNASQNHLTAFNRVSGGSEGYTGQNYRWGRNRGQRGSGNGKGRNPGNGWQHYGMGWRGNQSRPMGRGFRNRTPDADMYCPYYQEMTEEVTETE